MTGFIVLKYSGEMFIPNVGFEVFDRGSIPYISDFCFDSIDKALDNINEAVHLELISIDDADSCFIYEVRAVAKTTPCLKPFEVNML